MVYRTAYCHWQCQISITEVMYEGLYQLSGRVLYVVVYILYGVLLYSSLQCHMGTILYRL